MTLDLETLATILGLIATVGGGLFWFGRILVRATRAATALTTRMESLEQTISTLAHQSVSREDFAHWLERLGYRNTGLDIPDLPPVGAENA